jgi:transcriptional regulator with XRE-family HTH domain
MRMQAQRTTHAQTRTKGARTFRSGPYLEGLFTSAERMDAHLQAQICARIKQARIEAGYTQEEMADLLAMTMRGYQNYESNRVPFRQLDKIAELTNVTQMWLLRGDLPDASGSPDPEILERLARLEASVESLRQEVLAALGNNGEEQAAH